jgi:ABC-type glycerol-3-phosphate transport system substrate-binding protein
MKLSLYRLLLVGWSLSAVTLQARTLNILLLANASTQDVIQKLIREYQKQNPETDFNVSIVQSNSIIAKLNTLVTAGQPPNLSLSGFSLQNFQAVFASGSQRLKTLLVKDISKVRTEMHVLNPDR